MFVARTVRKTNLGLIHDGAADVEQTTVCCKIEVRLVLDSLQHDKVPKINYFRGTDFGCRF